MANGKGGRLIIAAAAVVVIVVVALAVASRFTSTESAPEVVSRRVKIEVAAAPEAQPQAGAVPAPTAEKTPEVKPAEVKPVPAAQPPAKPAPAAAKPEPASKTVQAPQPAAVAAKPAAPATAKSAQAKKGVAEKPRQAKTKAAKEKPAAGQWVVSVASFKTAADARAVVSTLRASRYRAYITEFKDKGVTWHRVRVGFYKSEADARKAAKALAVEFGFPKPWVTRPTRDEAARYSK